MKVVLLYLSLGAIFVLGAMIFRPVPIPPFEECLHVEGEVSKIYGTEEYDIVFFLKDHDTRYYINRGMQQGLSPDQLKTDLVGEVVSIYYPKYWTPLDPQDELKHMSRLTFKDEILWTEVE